MERKPVLRDDSVEGRAARFIKEFGDDIVREFGLRQALAQSLKYDDVFRVVRLYAVISDGPDGDSAEVVVERAQSIGMGDNRDILVYLEWAIRGEAGNKEKLKERMRAAELLVDDDW